MSQFECCSQLPDSVGTASSSRQTWHRNFSEGESYQDPINTTHLSPAVNLPHALGCVSSAAAADSFSLYRMLRSWQTHSQERMCIHQQLHSWQKLHASGHGMQQQLTDAGPVTNLPWYTSDVAHNKGQPLCMSSKLPRLKLVSTNVVSSVAQWNWTSCTAPAWVHSRTSSPIDIAAILAMSPSISSRCLHVEKRYYS